MSYKAKAEVIRAGDESAYRGGALTVQQPPPTVQRYPCFADGCPMAGTIFPNGTADGKPGVCAFHYAANPTDIPKITQVLNDWQCVANEIRAARRCVTGPAAADPATQDREQALAWGRLGPVVQRGGWGDVLAPRPGEHYGEWAKHLERFLGARVVEVLSVRRSER